MEKEIIKARKISKGSEISFLPVPGLGESRPEDQKHANCTDADPCPACLAKREGNRPVVT